LPNPLFQFLEYMISHSIRSLIRGKLEKRRRQLLWWYSWPFELLNVACNK
jgi:hypothetical protein